MEKKACFDGECAAFNPFRIASLIAREFVGNRRALLLKSVVVHRFSFNYH